MVQDLAYSKHSLSSLLKPKGVRIICLDSKDKVSTLGKEI